MASLYYHFFSSCQTKKWYNVLLLTFFSVKTNKIKDMGVQICHGGEEISLMATLGERLKLIRQGMTQRTFAAKLGIPQTTLSNYEKNKCELNLALAEQITIMFGISTDWLLFERGPMYVSFEHHGQNKITVDSGAPQKALVPAMQNSPSLLPAAACAEAEQAQQPQQEESIAVLIKTPKSYKTNQEFPTLRCMEPLPSYKY
jgi:transcriptional regulator with XRE-family HTH domain